MPEIPDNWIHEETLGPAEVGKIFNVDGRTVAKWANSGIIGFFRTPHGMRRFPVSEVKRIMANEPAPDFLKANAEEDKAKYSELWQSGWRRSPKIFEKRGDE